MEEETNEEIDFKIHEIDDSIIDLLEDAQNQLKPSQLKEII